MKQVVFYFLFFFATNYAQCQEKLDVFNVARTGSVEQAKQLVKQNQEAFNVINAEGFSPLLLACYRGNVEVVKFLIEIGCDINQKSSMGTPLMAAIVKGNNAIAEFLLLKKANVDLTDENGTTPLMYAVMFKNKGMVVMLLQKNADKKRLDNKGKSAFEYAVFTGNEEIINLLK